MNQEEEILDCTCGTRSMTVSGSGYAVLDKSGNVIYSSRGSVCDETCRGCVFRGSTGVTITCDHILITGRRRGCPAGAGCTRRLEGTARSMSIDARTFRLAPGAAAPPPDAAGASVLPKRTGGPRPSASPTPSPEGKARAQKKELTPEELAARERRRALDRARYYRDREKYLARAKARNKNLSEEQKRKKAEQSRQWRAKNREHANEYQRQRRKAETEEQRERRLAANREWMQTHKEQRNAWYREYRKKKAAEKEKNE